MPHRALALPGALLLALGSGACRAADRVHVLPAEPPPLEDGATFASSTLFASPRLSAHAVRVTGTLAPHLHERHAETVFVISGRARMRIGDETFELEPRTVVHVPEGVVHAVEVEGEAAVLSLFTPPFDGTDRVFVEE
jgi:quercetin dioxygenase-like cupin family protein